MSEVDVQHLCTLLDKAHNIIVTCHVSPDGDAMGSGASNKSPAGIPLIPTGPSVYISVTVTASLGRAIKRARQVTVSTGS